MELLIFLIVASYIFAVAGVIVLLIRTGGQSESLRLHGREMDLVKERAARQERDIAALRRALTEAGFPATDFAGETFPPERYPGPGDVPLHPHAPPPAAVHETAAPHLAPGPAEQPAAQTGEPQKPLPAAAEQEPAATWRTESPAAEGPAAPNAAFSLWISLSSFIKGGNLWVAGGVILLFAAFSLLLTYMARRGFFTVEMRIAAAIVCALAMLIFGWKFRLRKAVYALVIQGGGIGVLYLSFFAASKLTNLLPVPAALALVTLLIPSTIILALLQNAQPLAVFGLLGGFLAPILLSTGSGNYIALFTYYLALDIAVLIIGGRRLWRALSLIAAVCTFAVSLAWIADRYEPYMFATAEPFMAAFILIFTFIGIRSARGAAISLSNYDIPITIGTPFAGAIIQWQIFSHIEHGLAIVCIVFAAFYILLAHIIRKKTGAGIRSLAEGYLGLSVLLANLAIPLELSARLTSAVWAAEGVLVYFLGCRLYSRRIRAAAHVLHAAAVIAFFAELPARFGSVDFPAFRSPVFTGALIIALSAIITVILSNRFARDAKPVQKTYEKSAMRVFFTLWGLLFWMASWGAELYRVSGRAPAEFFIIASLTGAASYAAGRFFRSPQLYLGLAVPLLSALYITAANLFIRIVDFFAYSPLDILTFNFFEGRFLRAWLLFFVSQAVLLRLAAKPLPDGGAAGRRNVPQTPHAWWLALTLFIVVLVITCTARAFSDEILELSRSWTSLAGVLPSFICIAALSFLARGLPKAPYRQAVFVWLPRVLCAAVGIWFTGTLFAAGDPSPLPFYIPLINPLEIQQAFCLAIIIVRQLSLRRAGIEPAFKIRTLFTLVDLMIFLWLTAMAARSAHFFLNIPMSAVISAGQFQLALLILWGALGIAHILAGHRFHLRPLWLAGAALMVIDIAKLLLVDLAQTGTVTRIISFFVAGLLLLFIGWAAPLPPAHPAPGEPEK